MEWGPEAVILTASCNLGALGANAVIENIKTTIK